MVEPIHKLAMKVMAWVALAALAFFFQQVGFIVCIAWLAYYAGMLLFVFENTKDFPYGSNSTTAISTSEGTEGFGAALGSDWEGRIRENLPESEGRWNKRVME